MGLEIGDWGLKTGTIDWDWRLRTRKLAGRLGTEDW